jgi:protease I
MPAINQARILIMSADGFEQSELFVPLEQLIDKGAEVDIASPDGEAIDGWEDGDWGDGIEADLAIGEIDVDDYDALVLPGGQINPDLLRVNDDALSVIRTFHESGKLIAAVCHAPWLLIEAGLAKGLRATSYASIKTDMINAGAQWIDQSAVEDKNIITSRDPGDLDDFVEAIIVAVEKQPVRDNADVEEDDAVDADNEV